jgi:hypothetical protein
MMVKSQYLTLYFAVLVLVFLTACGSGSLPSATVDEDSIVILGPEENKALVGESIGLVLLTSSSDIRNIIWRQTAGESINFLGANRKVIGFDVPAVDSYSFSVSFNDAAGNSFTADYDFTASDESPVYINARLDHEANAMAKMSLHAYDNMPGNIISVNWLQMSGPLAVIDETNQLSINFIAPSVSIDRIMQFRVDVIDDQGNSASDLVNILIEPEPINSGSHFVDGRFADHSLADVYAYNRDSAHTAALEKCIYSNITTDFCDLAELPFLGTVNPTPSIKEIMDRVLVSHDWMGHRFETLLSQVDTSNDIKTLLGATRSIVISYDIRPSFFWSGTGAIYINADYFWVTPQERDTLDTAPDFRSDFGSELQFVDPWRVVKDNDYAFSTPQRSSRLVRPLQDSQIRVMRVLYHELAHANDYFPPRAWASVSGNDYPWSYSDTNQPDSSGLAASFPLISTQMYGLASVMFQGETADASQMAYTPAEVSDFFFTDDATNTYNYSTEREDYAMLAEEYLMSYRYGVLYDQGITSVAPDYIVATAERGRVGHARIKPRAEYVVNRILPNFDTSGASASLAEPITLQSGVSWQEALVAPGQNKTNNKFKSQAEQQILFGRDFHPARSIKRNH